MVYCLCMSLVASPKTGGGVSEMPLRYHELQHAFLNRDLDDTR